MSDIQWAPGLFCLTITPESYHRDGTHQRLADQVMAAHGLDKNTVCLIEMNEHDAVVTFFDHNQHSKRHTKRYSIPSSA